MSKKAITVCLILFALLGIVIAPSGRGADKEYVNRALGIFNIEYDFRLIAFKEGPSHLFEGISFEAVIQLSDETQVLDFIRISNTKAKTLTNNPEDIKRAMSRTFPALYKSLGKDLALFYHVIPPVHSTKRSGHVGFLIDKKSKYIYINYWES